MYSKRLLLTLGLLAFVVGLAVLAPVRFIVAASPGLAAQVSAAGGTLWAGQATINSMHGPVQVSWDSHPWQLLRLGLALDWVLTAPGAAAKGDLVVRPWGYVLDVAQGEMSAAWLARLLPEPRPRLDQPLLLRQVRLAGGLNGLPQEAAGTLIWGPGTLRLTNRPEPLQLPAFRGILQNTDTGHIRLVVEGEPQPGQPAITATLDPVTRAFEVVVLRRAADLAGLSLAGAPGSADKELLKMRQTLP